MGKEDFNPNPKVTPEEQARAKILQEKYLAKMTGGPDLTPEEKTELVMYWSKTEKPSAVAQLSEGLWGPKPHVPPENIIDIDLTKDDDIDE